MPVTTYAGIDYGFGKTNISPEGIRFGVISQNEVLQAWADSSEPEYPVTEVECPECSWPNTFESVGEEQKCTNCGAELEELFEHEAELAEPSCYISNKDGYEMSSDQVGDIFITKSPYFTYAQFCSPCAPGACYLMNWLDTASMAPVPLGNRCFCLGHDFFEDGKAPYPVHSVATGCLVEPDAVKP